MTDAPMDDTTRTVATPFGPVVAAVSHRDGVVRARGIRYAEADRFAAPRRTAPTTEPFRAETQAPASPQLSSPAIEVLLAGAGADMTASEDCLRLTVTAPVDVQADERLPVMVWIHGGSYVTGAGDVDIYDPVSFVTEQRVVVVGVTYRLGMFGFLGDGAHVPANLGLLDILAALGWVQDCIASFGGDPDLVTLFGQSSGADAIAHLMISDGAAGLFRRVVVQSAPLGLGRRRAAMSRAMLRATGIPSRTAPTDEVLALQPRAERAALRFGLRGGMPFGTQYGHAPLPGEVDRERAWEAVAPDVDLLIGSTSEETGLYAVLVAPVRYLGRVPLVGRLLRRWLVRATTHRIYTADARRFAARHRAAGGRAVSYELHWAPEGSELGPAHITDLPLLLGTERAWSGTALIGTTPWAEIDRRGRRVRALWAEFARTGTLAPDAAAGMRDTIRILED
ncbi:carboxylesterase family protein [Curtobacterium sp. Leaf261]|uniref:carboxylesterase family protein n=1 Tax=Curtobacterium sp. Leaf261 TaxID=1736311 RepID=UPI0006F7550D|nr:carboxylesterase family protein [Curtobacterium sp. Leaf261]KQO61441.1 carboxylesterase [Curtobacterium sp. Leaf261]